jgi:transcriptional regulator, BadM/Rrf2 family
MKLSRYTDYALRVLIYLAGRDQGLASIRQIAQAYAISHNHLMKIVQDFGAMPVSWKPCAGAVAGCGWPARPRPS